MAKIQDIRKQTVGGTSKRALSKVKNIARHHSATTGGDYFAFWKSWKAKGWKTGGYHEIILRDGTVQLCYDPNVITNGIKDHNSGTYHICVVGNGSFTEAQEKAFDERCKVAMALFNLPLEKVLGHKEFSGASTACPGIDMNMVRNRLKGKTTTVQATKTEVKTEVVKAPSKPKPTYTDNSFIKKFQDWLNKTYKFNLVVDGIYGPKTKKATLMALQTELNKQFGTGLKVDGIWGPKTKAAIRTVSRGAKGNITRIIQGMLYCLSFNPKGFDGDFGKNTYYAVMAFQRSEGLADDGKVGKNTFEKMY